MEVFVSTLEASSHRLFDAETEFPQHQFLHSEFLNFARDRHWKLIDETDVAWNFERRDLTATEFPDVALCCTRTCLQANPCADLFSVLFIWNPDDLHIA